MLNVRKVKIIGYASSLFVTSGILLGLLAWSIISDWDNFLFALIDIWNVLVMFKATFLVIGVLILGFLCLFLYLKLYEAINESEEAINESE